MIRKDWSDTGLVAPRALDSEPLPHGGGVDSIVQAAGQENSNAKRQALLFTIAGVITVGVCGWLLSAHSALAEQVDSRKTRTDSLVQDARQILQLRDRPKQVSESSLQRAELLQRVSAAMTKAGIDAQALVSTLPQPPRQAPGSDQAEIAHRLIFENVGLEAIVRFCHVLVDRDPQLRVSGIQLRAGSLPTTWNADLTISYWMLSPRAARP